jgi:hypothetical protein
MRFNQNVAGEHSKPPLSANPQANNYANTKIFACAVNELTS